MANIIFTNINFNVKISEKALTKKLEGIDNLCEWVMPTPSTIKNYDEAFEWRVKNWGTKGSSITEIGDGYIEITSAWNYPNETIFQMICDKMGKPFDHMDVQCAEDVFIKTYKPNKKGK